MTKHVSRGTSVLDMSVYFEFKLTLTVLPLRMPVAKQQYYFLSVSFNSAVNSKDYTASVTNE